MQIKYSVFKGWKLEQTTLWCLIEGALEYSGGWKNPQKLISRVVGINRGGWKIPLNLIDFLDFKVKFF